MLPLSDPSLRTGKRPYVNVAIIAVNALVFLYEIASGSSNVFFFKFGLIPDELTNGKTFTSLITPTGYVDITTPLPTWATLLTSMFIHGSWMHFIGNMVYLWVFGDNIEARIGHVLYLAFYLAAGIVAAYTQVAIDPSSQTPTIGASGAIAGVLGAYLVLYPTSRITTLVFMFFITVIQIPAVLLLGVWILMQFVSGVGSLGISSQSGGVAYWAHIGGFAMGMAVFWFYKQVTERRRRPDSWAGS